MMRAVVEERGGGGAWSEEGAEIAEAAAKAATLRPCTVLVRDPRVAFAWAGSCAVMILCVRSKKQHGLWDRV